jgi:hypothetical protein
MSVASIPKEELTTVASSSGVSPMAYLQARKAIASGRGMSVSPSKSSLTADSTHLSEGKDTPDNAERAQPPPPKGMVMRRSTSAMSAEMTSIAEKVAVGPRAARHPGDVIRTAPLLDVEELAALEQTSDSDPDSPMPSKKMADKKEKGPSHRLRM